MAGIAIALAGCATYPGWLNASGPSREQMGRQKGARGFEGLQLVAVDDLVTRRLVANRRQSLFSEYFRGGDQPAYAIGPGDVIEVSVWEAPPATLFGGAAGGAPGDSRSSPATTRVTTFPEQMVSRDGTINVPFIGRFSVGGHDPQWIEEQAARQLERKANQPQVMVRIVKNVTSTVTVVGEVSASARVSLTARGESILDALAACGGVRQPVNRTTIQLTRGDQVQSMPLQAITQDPRQNIPLRAGDVITALYQPASLTVLGASGRNQELSFETQGISLAQALARSGGLNDALADARGVFVFRFEAGSALDWPATATRTVEGRVPVIYQVDLRDRAGFFLAQGFPMEDGDVLYVTNAPAAELQKFANIVAAAFYPAAVAITLKPRL
jgi:polysaccharide export outer membrane protein